MFASSPSTSSALAPHELMKGTLPRTPRDVLAALYNILVLRTTDGLMRKVVGQPWNERNERLAVRRTHARLGLA